MSELDYTITEIRAELIRIQARVKAGAYVGVSSTVGAYRRAAVAASCYPNGIGQSESFRVEGENFRDALKKLEAAWEERQDTYTAETIRKMALAIISTTLDLGSCSDAALRGQGFSQGDIDRLGGRACDVANEMAGKGPFEIVQHATNANAPAEAA